MIRDFRLSDIDDVYRIASASLDESYSPDVFKYFYMQWPAGQLVLCTPNDIPIGFISSAKIDRDTARIMMFAVDPMFRSRGLGRTLINAFRNKALIDGIRIITLEVRETNERAIRFYRKNGFMPSELLPGFYNDGGTAVKMLSSVQLNI